MADNNLRKFITTEIEGYNLGELTALLNECESALNEQKINEEILNRKGLKKLASVISRARGRAESDYLKKNNIVNECITEILKILIEKVIFLCENTELSHDSVITLQKKVLSVSLNMKVSDYVESLKYSEISDNCYADLVRCIADICEITNGRIMVSDLNAHKISDYLSLPEKMDSDCVITGFENAACESDSKTENILNSVRMCSEEKESYRFILDIFSNICFENSDFDNSDVTALMDKEVNNNYEIPERVFNEPVKQQKNISTKTEGGYSTSVSQEGIYISGNKNVKDKLTQRSFKRTGEVLIENAILDRSSFSEINNLIIRNSVARNMSINIFQFSDIENLTFEKCFFDNLDNNSFKFSDCRNIVFENCTFEDCHFAIFVHEDGDTVIRINDCKIIGADHGKGMITNQTGRLSLEIENTLFYDCDIPAVKKEKGSVSIAAGSNTFIKCCSELLDDLI